MAAQCCSPCSSLWEHNAFPHQIECNRQHGQDVVTNSRADQQSVAGGQCSHLPMAQTIVSGVCVASFAMTCLLCGRACKPWFSKFSTLHLQHHAKDQNAAVLGSTEWKAYSARAKAWCVQDETPQADAEADCSKLEAQWNAVCCFAALTLSCPFASLKEAT